MSELSDASTRLLGLEAWPADEVATVVHAETDESEGHGLRLGHVVVDPPARRPSLSVAEPYAAPPALEDLNRPAKEQFQPHGWVVGELGVVLLVSVGVAWLVGAGPLGDLLALGLAAVAYRSRHVLGASVHPGTLTRDLSFLFSVVALAVAVGVAPTAALSQSVAVLASAGAVIVLVAGVCRRLRPAVRVLVVGDRASISRAAMRWSDGRGLEVVAGVRSDPAMAGAPPLSIVGVPTTAGLDNVPDLIRRHRVDLVMVSSGHGVSDSELRRLSWLLENHDVELVVLDAVGSAAPHRVVPVRLANTTALRVLPSNTSAPVRLAKEILDRVLGLCLLVVSLPVVGLLVLLVRLDSPGPGLYRQVRIGRDGAPFVMYKLRSMTVDADRALDELLVSNEGSGLLFKIHDDPRVTRVGRLLRRTSLDEMAQLINVVRGEMSLVGPRPALPTEVAQYDDVELRRLAVRPGITGLWQVSGRSDLSWDAGMSLDLHYADNWRLRGDASILARTFGAVVRRRGAY